MAYINIYIFSWLVAKARKGKVLVPTARTVVLTPGRKHGWLVLDVLDGSDPFLQLL